MREREQHHMRHEPEYAIWNMMKARCYRPKTFAYPWYGGRGIQVCERWRNSFVAFIEDVGRRPSADFTIERKNNNGNYEPGNVIWALRSTQNSNRRSNVFYEWGGEKLTLKQICDSRNISYPKTWKRMKRGWELERAVTT